MHLREAHDDALAILRETGVPKAGCIVHCFNLDAQTLAPFLELGCYVAFGGPLTFKKSWETRAAALDVPLDRLLTETDAPYMAPEPLRARSARRVRLSSPCASCSIALDMRGSSTPSSFCSPGKATSRTGPWRR